MANEIAEEKLLTTVPEAAKLLRVKDNTLRVWLSKGMVIPAGIIRRLGGRVLFDTKALYNWVENGCADDNKKNAVVKTIFNAGGRNEGC